MMVRQTRIVFEIGDVMTFKLCCGTCKSEFLADLKRLQKCDRCPFCDANWEPSNEMSPVRDTLRALERLVMSNDTTRAIRFEIDGDESSNSQ